MATVTQDLTRFQKAVDILERIYQHRKLTPTTKSDEIYYRLIFEYNQRLLRAKSEGKTIAGYGLMIPNEILLAMDIVPLHMEMGSSMLVSVLKLYDDVFAASKSFGLAVELCSAHRTMAGVHVLGWTPRPDFVVWCSTICQSCAKSGELIAELWNVPKFFLDRPFLDTKDQVAYFANELRDMVGFLEKQTGKKMDWDRLRDIVAASHRCYQIHREIQELRRRVPSPVYNKVVVQNIIVEWLFGGTPEATQYYSAVRDDMKAMADQGRSPYPEKFRILTIFVPPLQSWKLMDWLQKEKGVSLVGDPMDAVWHEWELDPRDPLITLSRKVCAEPHGYSMHGPVEKAVEVCVQDALDVKAEGAIYWAALTCPQGCAMIKPIRDALKDKADIPTLIVNMDVNDPSIVPESEIKEKIEGFLETLEERR